jgi:divalent metal cation (Fe/Co/Zn/Cd) transporter
MAKDKEVNTSERIETSIVPLKYVDTVEDVFHAVLALALLIIGIGAFFYTIERLITTAPFFPNGMIQGVNDILFIVTYSYRWRIRHT